MGVQNILQSNEAGAEKSIFLDPDLLDPHLAASESVWMVTSSIWGLPGRFALAVLVWVDRELAHGEDQMQIWSRAMKLSLGFESVVAKRGSGLRGG